MNMDLKLVLEAILFSSQKALNSNELRDVLRTAAKMAEETGQDAEVVKSYKALAKTEESTIIELLEALSQEHEEAQRSYRLTCVAGSWKFVSMPAYAPWLMALIGKRPRPPKLTPTALETLAIVAYRQPLTRSQIEQIRGVSVDGAMQKLLERGLVEQAGKLNSPGRPGLYVTTDLFLDYFGLKDLQGLPDAEELLRIPMDKPEGLATIDEGLATAPESELRPEVDADEVLAEPGATEPTEPTEADEAPYESPDLDDNNNITNA